MMMWKIFAGFVVFAAAMMFLLMKAGDKVDLQGESHGQTQVETTPAQGTKAPEPAASAPAPAPSTPAEAPKADPASK
jgi:hypothetical protein